jgi:hypothetical protein
LIVNKGIKLSLNNKFLAAFNFRYGRKVMWISLYKLVSSSAKLMFCKRSDCDIMSNCIKCIHKCSLIIHINLFWKYKTQITNKAEKKGNVFFLQWIFSVRVTTLENLNSNYEQTIITINDKAYVVLSLAPLESLLRSVCLYTNIHKYTYYVRWYNLIV